MSLLSTFDGSALLNSNVLSRQEVQTQSFDLGAIQSQEASSYGSYSLISGVNQSSRLASDSLVDLGISGISSSAGISLNANSQRNVVSYGLSEIENAILRSTQPLNINETEEITVNGQRGIWANKSEVTNWRGPISITQYQINQDQNPEIIRKQTSQSLTYIQELAVKYLRPPTPPAPGEIVITQQANTVLPPAPPVVIRQQPPRPTTPAPLVIREAPPQPPARVGRKIVTISGKTIPPPPRKVVIERLAPLPNKPQAVFVERWLPYSQVKRRVIFQKSNQVDPVVVKPRNVVIQWDSPRVEIKKEFKNLGVVRANPAEYVQKYGASLRTSDQLPQFVLDIKPPQGVVLAANYRYNNLHELYGDVQALRLINLEKEGLGGYRDFLSRVGMSGSSYSGASVSNNVNYSNISDTSSTIIMSETTSSSNSAEALVDDIFRSVNTSGTGRLSVEEAVKLLLQLNSKLGRNYGEDEVVKFFGRLDANNDNTIDIDEFRRAFLSLV